MRTARRVISLLLAVGVTLGALIISAGGAVAGTSYWIDSIAGCQAFLDAVGANLGRATQGQCTVSSESSEVHLNAGDSLTVDAGWTLFFNAVVSMS